VPLRGAGLEKLPDIIPPFPPSPAARTTLARTLPFAGDGLISAKTAANSSSGSGIFTWLSLASFNNRHSRIQWRNLR